MFNAGIVRPGKTLYVPFESFAGSTGAPITLTGLAVGDVKIYKDGSTTERASTSGYTLLDTDGIDFDAITGIHGFSIDLADNATADFFQAGSQYWVVISTVTVDSQTMSFVAATFRIGYHDAVLDTFIATLASQTSFTLSAGPAEDDALNGMELVIHDAASAVQWSRVVVDDYAGSTKTVTLAAGATFTVAAKDNVSVIGLSPLTPLTAGRKLDVTAANKVNGVVLVDTLTTYTGNTVQTGDSFGRIGATGSGLTSLAPSATALSSAVYTSARAGYLDNINVGAVASAANLATVAGYLDTEIAAILAVTVKLDTTLVLDGAVYQFTANALELAPTGGSAPTVGQIADAVWDEARADHVAAGSFGEALDATISSRSTLVAADIRTAVGLASANLDTQLAAVQTDTNDIQTRLPAALIGGRMVANLEAIDNLTTAGNNATLNLKKLNVVNDAGDAFVASSTGGNGSGVAASGHGTGSGVKGTGGATGHGVYGVGGATSGNGILGAATAGNSNGVRGTGFGSGSGFHGEGGDTGNGFRGVGGAVSGAGIHGRGVLGNSPGMELVGQGSAAGLLSTGGAIGPGQRLVGGSTSGTALELAITAGSVYVTTAAVTASFEAIAITAPTGPAANFREMAVQIWRRLFKKATLSGTELKTYADNGSTVITTQAVSDAAGLQTEDAAV